MNKLNIYEIAGCLVRELEMNQIKLAYIGLIEGVLSVKISCTMEELLDVLNNITDSPLTIASQAFGVGVECKIEL